MNTAISLIAALAVIGGPALLALRYGAESRPGFDERRIGRHNL